MSDFIDWTTATGTYRYWFLDNPFDASSIQSEAGNYMFVMLTNTGWVPVYIGIADDLSDRIPNHDKRLEAAILGATHVMAHLQPSFILRSAEEVDLIQHFQPALNVQHKKPKTGLGGLGF